MTGALSPTEAAVLADSAYATLGSPDPARDAARAAGGSSSPFDVLSSSVFTGITGFGNKTNFGYCAYGKPGPRQGDFLISVRGTDMPSGSDWLTNGKFAGARGPNGFMVHKGFNQLMETILPQVKTAMKNRSPSAIHLVGHSLGGATATLLADALKDEVPMYLYTFGAPRAGTLEHAQYLTNKLKPQNIFRVYHDTDPVPMVPLYPYCHCPAADQGYLLKGSGMIIWPGAHSMKLYNSNAKASWGALSGSTIDHRRFSLDTVDDVLQQASALPGGYFSALLMRLIVKALGIILDAVGIGLGLALLGAATIADQIAFVISKGVELAGIAAETLNELVRQIMRFVGIKIVGTVSMSAQFLKWLLDKLFDAMAAMARNATRMLL